MVYHVKVSAIDNSRRYIYGRLKLKEDKGTHKRDEKPHSQYTYKLKIFFLLAFYTCIHPYVYVARVYVGTHMYIYLIRTQGILITRLHVPHTFEKR